MQLINFEQQIGHLEGVITEIDMDEGDGSLLYHVQYEDSDEEGMGVGECKDAVSLYNKLENGDIDEWEHW